MNETKEHVINTIDDIAGRLYHIGDLVNNLGVTPRTLSANRDECVTIRQLLIIESKNLNTLYTLMGELKKVITATVEPTPEPNPEEVARQERIREITEELQELQGE